MRVRLPQIVVVTLVCLAPLGAQGRLSRQEAERFHAKLEKIVAYGNTTGARTAARSTPMTDVEVNSYLKFLAGDQIPAGIVDPTLSAVGAGRVSGRAIVDLDAVRKQKERGWLDPMGYLTGRLPVTASGHLTAQDGVGRFQLESAEVSGITVPKAVLQELLSYYSRTPDNPSGINMDDPFELPARIREIRVGTGTATVVQ
ncbi:MAG TPA: hypothetical protein VF147_10040 [Vicinamibacterales bacterium]